MWWIVGFVILAIVIGQIDEKWHRERGGRKDSQSKRKNNEYFEHDNQYVSRAKRRREEERRKRDENARREWYDDYESYTDKNGDEHTLDYDNYCDECDEYHEE